MSFATGETQLIQEDGDAAAGNTRQLKKWKSFTRLVGARRVKDSGPNQPGQFTLSSAIQRSTVGIVAPAQAEGTVDHFTAQSKSLKEPTAPLAVVQTASSWASDTYTPEETEAGANTLSVAEEKALLDQATSFITAPPPYFNSTPHSSLPLPVVIPRIEKGRMSPLARAWAPELAARAITQHDFTTFVDNLNILSSPPAASTLLHVAAFGVQFAPFDGADGVALLTELAAAGVGYFVVTSRCERFLATTNDEYFHPRGLHARLMPTKKMRHALSIPKEDTLVAPLTENTVNMTAHERCVEGMRAYACELTHDGVPDPSPRTKALERVAAWYMRHQIRHFDKVALKRRKRAWKRHLKGKKLKKEGKMERARVKMLQWLVIQNLDEFERQERELAERAEEKKQKKKKKTKKKQDEDEEIEAQENGELSEQIKEKKEKEKEKEKEKKKEKKKKKKNKKKSKKQEETASTSLATPTNEGEKGAWDNGSD